MQIIQKLNKKNIFKMLPKFLTHFDKKKRRTTMSATKTTTILSRCTKTTATFPLVLLGSILFLLVLQSGSINAEKDFNFNDSQVSKKHEIFRLTYYFIPDKVMLNMWLNLALFIKLSFTVKEICIGRELELN